MSFTYGIRGKYENSADKHASARAEGLEYIRADTGFVSPSYTRVYPLVVESARGLWVQDVDGTGSWISRQA